MVLGVGATNFSTFVKFKGHVVLFVNVKSPAAWVMPSMRSHADLQAQQSFGEIIAHLKIPVLYGISAFGTRLCFYRYAKGPYNTNSSLDSATPATHVEQWDCDILQTEGVERLWTTAAAIKVMCNSM